MSSQRKIEANRRNGALSRGPKTPGGRARSAQNARRHGYLADTIVLSSEQKPIFDRLHQDFTDHYNPLTVVEEQYLLEMVWARWRLMRLWNAEDCYIEVELTKAQTQRSMDPYFANINDSAKTGIIIAQLTRNGEVLDSTSRYEVRVTRLFNVAKKNLLEAQAERRARAAEEMAEQDAAPNEPNSAPTLVEIAEPNEPTAQPESAIEIAASNEPNARETASGPQPCRLSGRTRIPPNEPNAPRLQDAPVCDKVA